MKCREALGSTGRGSNRRKQGTEFTEHFTVSFETSNFSGNEKYGRLQCEVHMGGVPRSRSGPRTNMINNVVFSLRKYPSKTTKEPHAATSVTARYIGKPSARGVALMSVYLTW